MPDFIPLERSESSQSPHYMQNPQKPSYHNTSPPFKDNRKHNHKNNNRISEEQHQNRREGSSGSMERQKRKHSPITHHPSSSQPSKYRSKSPTNLKVTARVGTNRHNGSFTEYDNYFKQYDECNQRRSPIVFDLDHPRRHSMNESNGHSIQKPSTSSQHTDVPENGMRTKERDNIFVSLNCREYCEIPHNNINGGNEEEDEMAKRLVTLEKDKKQLLAHCNGLRDSIDQYYREISKLESLIHTWTQEIEILKRRIYK